MWQKLKYLQNHRLSADTRHALCHVPSHTAFGGAALQECKACCNFGKCGKSNKCRSNFPFCGGTWNGCSSLTPACADPLYRRASRVSMGTVFQIPWTYFDKNACWPDGAMDVLHKLGYKTAAMALRDDSVSIDDEK